MTTHPQSRTSREDVRRLPGNTGEIESLTLFPEQNPSPVMRVDLAGLLLYANPGSEPLLAEWQIKVGDAVPEPLCSAVNAARHNGQPNEVSVSVDRRDFVFNAVPVLNAGCVNLYGHDVSELMQSQAAEKRRVVERTAEQIAIDTMSATGEAYAFCDADGQIRTVNDDFAVLTTGARSELVGRNIREILPDIFDEPVGKVAKTLGRIRLKSSMQDPADALTIITCKGDRKSCVPSLTTLYGPQSNAVGMVLTLKDMTSLFQARANLHESERLYRELVEETNSIIMRVTTDGRVAFLNQYAQDFFGYTYKELVGQRVIGTIIPEVDSGGLEPRTTVENMVSHPEAYGACDMEALCKDGRRVWVHWANRAVRDERGCVKEVLCTGTDITERKQLERRAEIYRRRLRALADRLTQTEERLRRQLASHIHDSVIQTLSLSVIRLGGVMAAVEKAGMTEQQKRIKGVRQLLDEGTAECRRLMEKLVPSMLYDVGLYAALRDFARKQSEADGTPIRVEGTREAIPEDEALQGLLFQCARELTMNALKYAGPCEIHIALISVDGGVQLQVRDSGRGFDPADIDPEEYDESGGFGLLNIRERIQVMNGRLEIESAPGQGTTVCVFVPIAYQPSPGDCGL